MSTMKSENPKQKQVNRQISQIRLRIQHLLASWGTVSKHRILEPDRIWKSRTPAVSPLSLVSFFSLPLACCQPAGTGKVVRPSGPDIQSIAGLHTERPIKNQHSPNWVWPLGAGFSLELAWVYMSVQGSLLKGSWQDLHQAFVCLCLYQPFDKIPLWKASPRFPSLASPPEKDYHLDKQQYVKWLHLQMD